MKPLPKVVFISMSDVDKLNISSDILDLTDMFMLFMRLKLNFVMCTNAGVFHRISAVE